MINRLLAAAVLAAFLPLAGMAAPSTFGYGLVVTGGAFQVTTTGTNVPTLNGARIATTNDLTNLSASALSAGTVPLARLAGITSNQIDAATDTAYRSGGGVGGDLSALSNGLIAVGGLATGAFDLASGSSAALSNQMAQAVMLTGGTWQASAGQAVTFLAGTNGDATGASVDLSPAASSTVGGDLHLTAGSGLDIQGNLYLTAGTNGGGAPGSIYTTGILYGDGSGLTNLPSSGGAGSQTPLTNNVNMAGFAATNGSFSGNGAGLTNLISDRDVRVVAIASSRAIFTNDAAFKVIPFDTISTGSATTAYNVATYSFTAPADGWLTCSVNYYVFPSNTTAGSAFVTEVRTNGSTYQRLSKWFQVAGIGGHFSASDVFYVYSGNVFSVYGFASVVTMTGSAHSATTPAKVLWHWSPRKVSMIDTNTLRVILLAGQSNANGPISATRGTPDGDYSNVYTLASMYDTEQDRGTTSRQPVDDNGRWGAELALSRLMVGRWGASNVAVWKVAYPGSSMFVDWEPSSGSVWSWFKTHLANARTAYWTRPNVSLEGLVWVQGEADAGNSTWASAYETNMVRFIGNVRSAVGDTNMPLAIYRLHSSEGDTYASTIRTAQNTLTSQPRVAVFNVDSDTMYDSQHLSNSGYHLLASNAWIALTNFWGS